MAVTTTKTNKPLNPRGNDQSPKGYNRAELYSGKVLDFDGTNDKVNITTSSFDLYAISFYFKGAIGTASNGFAFHSGGATNDGVSLGSLTGSLTNETITIGEDGDYTAITETYDDGIHFITFSWDATNSKYKAYVNAQEIETINNGSDASLITGITAPALGVRKPLSDMYLDGGLSNVRAFSTALTAAQVADLYNNPEKIVPTGVADSALKLWLPMQEGAGTTAYDGSGNGNHGTISGATWTHGIGAPVAQTAVIDWNKGTNEVLYSEDFSQSNWATSNMTKTTGQTDYIGGTNAVRVTCSSGVNAWFSQPTSGVAVGDVTIGAYIKGVSSSGTLSFSTAGTDRSNSRINYTTDWVFYEWTITETSSSPRIQIDNYSDGGGQEAIDVYFCFPRLVEGTNADVYVRTGATAQTSDVLLPQGLTTGRDITGVNLFENVRKQGALNLDGNSWAEVHDNASVDLTDGVSLECWVYRDGESGYFGFVGKWVNNGNRSYLIATEPSNVIGFYVSKNGSALVQNSYTLSASGWHHLVGTEDGTNLKLYVDGVLVDTDATTSGDIFTSAYNVEIGRYNNSTTNEYANQIAQPRIYNRALTAEEVERNYNAGKNTYK